MEKEGEERAKTHAEHLRKDSPLVLGHAEHYLAHPLVPLAPLKPLHRVVRAHGARRARRLEREREARERVRRGVLREEG